MQNKEIKLGVITVAASLLLANPAFAFDMGNMMNPSKWMGNKDNDRDDYYDEPGYGYPGGPPGYYGGAPGYGGGPGYGGDPGYGYGGAPGYGGDPGYGYGGAPGYGGDPGYGYGGEPGYGGDPGYGYGGAPGYGGDPGYGAAPGYGGAPGYGAPGTGSREAEIMRLKERLRQLEGDVK